MTTARDIVLTCVATGGDPNTVTAGELAQGKPITVEAGLARHLPEETVGHFVEAICASP